MFGIVWSRCKGLSMLCDMLPLAGNRTPGILAGPRFGPFLTKFAKSGARGTSGYPKRAIPSCRGTTNQKKVPNKFETTFIGPKLRCDSVLCRQTLPTAPKKKAKNKNPPQGRKYCPRTPAVHIVKRRRKSLEQQMVRPNPAMPSRGRIPLLHPYDYSHTKFNI